MRIQEDPEFSEATLIGRVFHDKNGDRTLNSVAGIPSEDYGFSADARDLFGPPSFEEARLELAAGESKQIAFRVK